MKQRLSKKEGDVLAEKGIEIKLVGKIRTAQPNIGELIEWVVKNEENYMVSRKTKTVLDTLRDAYKFIAEHRMSRDLKGKDRPKCLYFKEGMSMIPFVGIFYTIPKIIKKVPIKYMFSTPVTLVGASVVQVISLIILLVLAI